MELDFYAKARFNLFFDHTRIFYKLLNYLFLIQSKCCHLLYFFVNPMRIISYLNNVKKISLELIR